MKNIVVNATVAREAGALTIIRQLSQALSEYRGDCRFTVFHYPGLDLPAGENVRYIPIPDTDKWAKRIRWDLSGLAKRCAAEGIQPDAVLSLQNTGMGKLGSAPQVIYVHQPLPFTPNIKLSPIKEPKLFFYRHIYKRLMKWTILSGSSIVVQTSWMKESVMRVMGWSEQNIHLLRPDVPRIESELIHKDIADGKLRLFYPAMLITYKNHRLLLEAMEILRRKYPDIFPDIAIYFTLKPQELEIPAALKVSFHMLGYLDHDAMMRQYAGSDAMLFPSYVETFGLPLLEGAAFGMEVVAADLPYSRDVMRDYQGAVFLPHTDAAAWADEIARIYRERPCFERLQVGCKSDYGELIKLLSGIAGQTRY